MSRTVLSAAPPRAGVAPRTPAATLRAAFENTGSTRWMMQTIKHHGLDAKHGWRLELELLGDRVRGAWQSTEAALAQGLVDLIDTDWISIARARAGGLPLCAVAPYGTILGGLVAARGCGICGLDDLRRRRIGVVRRLDKNWALLRAACAGRHGFDLQASAIVVESGSKTQLRDDLRRGLVDAAVLHWQLIPQVLASGEFTEILDLADLPTELGADRAPTSFFACHDSLCTERPRLVQAFAASLADAVALLRDDADAWLAAVIGAGAAGHAAAPQVVRALRRKWLRRVCGWGGGNRAADLERLLETIVARCGADAAGLERMPPGTFMRDCGWRNP